MTSRLLLADDSVTIQRVIELTFADEPVEVTAVDDGRTAIERIQADPPDIVLADIGMPERDGYEVAAFLKTQPHLAHIPVVLLTGAFEPLDEARARASGCDAVLVKPFEPQTVITRVRELLAGRRAPAPAVATPIAAIRPAPPTASAGEEPAESAHTPVGESRAGIDDYLERLDAALSSYAGPPARPSQAQEGGGTAAIDDEDAAPGRSPVVVLPAGSIAMSDAFAALLAAEEGRADAPAPPVLTAVSEELVEEIVRRVIARLGDTEMRRLVLDTAERLVREEIERIKAR